MWKDGDEVSAGSRFQGKDLDFGKDLELDFGHGNPEMSQSGGITSGFLGRAGAIQRISSKVWTVGGDLDQCKTWRSYLGGEILKLLFQMGLECGAAPQG